MVEKLKINLPAAIIGLGVSGESTLNLLLAAGVAREQIATLDQKIPADFSDPDALLTQFKPKTLIVSPGVPLSQDWIHNFKGDLASELALAFQFITTEKIIAVTGSVGKSTVVSILGSALNAFSKNSFWGGNLGTPLAKYAEELIAGRKAAPWVVLELSSYQLENFKNLSCDFSAITFLTPNHLERYASLEDYYKTKWRLVELTRQCCVLNSKGGDLRKFAESQRTTLQLNWVEGNSSLKSSLLGEHNQDNFAVAVRLAELAGWPKAGFEAMEKFPGLPHRMENLGIHGGIRYVNDSKATTIESVKTAVESLIGTCPGVLHLLLGGRDKNLPWESLGTLRKYPQIKFYFFGECGGLAQAKSNLPGNFFPSLEAAISGTRSFAVDSDTVLLSPGGSSLDEFKNFEDRGETFKRLITI